MKSETPITDEHEIEIQGDMVVYSDISRSIERRLNRQFAKSLKKRRVTKQMRIAGAAVLASELDDPKYLTLGIDVAKEVFKAMLTASANEQRGEG